MHKISLGHCHHSMAGGWRGKSYLHIPLALFSNRGRGIPYPFPVPPQQTSDCNSFGLNEVTCSSVTARTAGRAKICLRMRGLFEQDQ